MYFILHNYIFLILYGNDFITYVKQKTKFQKPTSREQRIIWRIRYYNYDRCLGIKIERPRISRRTCKK